jgi:hypothetical protein
MMYVFLAGVMGFFVYDTYRVRRTWDETGRLEVTFRSLLGLGVHLFVYLGCGLFGLAINFDVLGSCCAWSWFPELNDGIAGPSLRAFALGLAGPAGLSKGRVAGVTSDGLGGDASVSKLDFGDLNVARQAVHSRIVAYLRVLFMR